jgi:hypothetical protein
LPTLLVIEIVGSVNTVMVDVTDEKQLLMSVPVTE